MSYEIIYQYHVHRVSGEEAGDGVDRYVLSVEMGSNNCCDHNGKRSRSWQVFALGTHDEVLRQAVRIGSSCEGGMLKPGGRDCTPEAFIGKVRRLLKKAQEPGQVRGWWTPEVRVGEPAVAERARELGASVAEEKLYGQTVSIARFEGKLAEFFKFVTEQHRSMYGWQMGKVHGLPSS